MPLTRNRATQRASEAAVCLRHSRSAVFVIQATDPPDTHLGVLLPVVQGCFGRPRADSPQRAGEQLFGELGALSGSLLSNAETTQPTF